MCLLFRLRAARVSASRRAASSRRSVRQIATPTSRARSAKRPSGEARRRSARSSASSSSSRSPKRCGAAEESEKTDATTSSSERSKTRPPPTSRRRGPLNPAAARISSSPDAVPSGSAARPARRTGPRYDRTSASIASRGGCGAGSPSSPPTPRWVVAATWTSAPPGSSRSRTAAATRGRSIQWNDCAKVATRKVPRLAGSSSARSRMKRAFEMPSRSASATIAASASMPTTSPKSGAKTSASEPGPQPTSSSRTVPSNPSSLRRASASSGG